MKYLYRIAINLYVFAIRIAALFNTKAKLWIEGRKGFFKETKSIAEKFQHSTNIWFHCASLGEFEMVRPLIEKLKHKKPDIKIILSFFSPSGYEVRKNYAQADLVCYLPKDSPTNAKKFIAVTQPQTVIFAKYEYWYFYLNELKKNNIPVYLVSAVFTPKQIFFKWYGGFFRNILKLFSGIYVINNSSQKQLQQIGINSIVAGDTRFDRAIENAANRKDIPHIESFKKNHRIIVVGSSWQKEEELLASYLIHSSDKKIIFAPHDISEKHIQSIEKLFSFTQAIRYSRANENNISKASVLIIDNIGLLSSLYYYADVVIVGGGFKGNLHNILEALVYHKPVLFGNKFKPKFSEAYAAIDKKCAFVISDFNEMQSLLNKLSHDKALYNQSAEAAHEYIVSNAGACELIFSETLEKYC